MRPPSFSPLPLARLAYLDLICRDDARVRFLASRFFRAWHPAVLDVYLECGLVDSGSGDGGVVLKTSNIQVSLSIRGCSPRTSMLTRLPAHRKR